MSERIINEEQHKDYMIHRQFKVMLLIVSIAGVLLFFFGYYLGISGKESPWIEPILPKPERQLRQNGVSSVAASAKNKPQPNMPSPGEIKFLDGKILKIEEKDKKIIFKVSGPANFLDKVKKYSLQRTIILTDSTNILKFKTLKSKQEIRMAKKEDLIQMMGGFIKKIRLNISDLEEGDLISVVAEENVVRKKSFEALEIRLLKKAK